MNVGLTQRRPLLESLRALPERTVAGFMRNFGGAEPILCHTAALTGGIVIGANFAASYWPRRVGYILCICTALVLLELALYLARALLSRLLGHSLGWLLALTLVAGSVADTVRRGAGEGWTWRVCLFSALTAAAVCALPTSWWAMIVKQRRLITVFTVALLSTAALAALAAFILFDGFPDRRIANILALSPRPDAAQAALEPSLVPGPYPVETLDYGPDTALDAGTACLTPYMSRDTGDLAGDYVDAYWDYDLNAVPLAGRVWYPAGVENCPVLFIAHGNHEIRTPSYQGYGYLGSYLASHGYVVVSVDENACNMLTGENDGRAVLLLKHIGKILQFNDEQGNPLYRKLDVDNLAVAGHSRGGEMAATAYLFNGYDQYPENGNVRFHFGYSIRSVIAIAPTVDQYQPADHSVAIEDVNYLLLHGAADRDVTSFMGMSQYEHVTFSGQGDYLKSALYIAGANHGQFNSLWGVYDQHGSYTPLLNRRSLLSEADQQALAQVFIKVFLDVTLKGDDSCRDLLTAWDRYAGQLPDTVYYQCWESSRFIPVADFEEDSDLETGTMEGTSLKAMGMNWWTEELMNFGGEEDTHAVRLRWSGRGTYRVALPAMDLRGGAVRFDICDLDTGAVERGEYALVDGVVRITDSGGAAAEAAISSFATVFPILPVQTDKLDFLFDTCVYKKAMSTVDIPAEAFVSAEAPIDLSSVTEIEIIFSGPGEAAVDNIGIEAGTRGTEAP